AVGFDCGDRTIDGFHRNCAFESVGAFAFDEFAAFLHGSHDAGLLIVTSDDLEEAGRSPGLEFPAENFLIELTGAIDVVNVDGEVGELACHGINARLECPWRTCDKLPRYVEIPPRRRWHPNPQLRRDTGEQDAHSAALRRLGPVDLCIARRNERAY